MNVEGERRRLTKEDISIEEDIERGKLDKWVMGFKEMAEMGEVGFKEKMETIRQREKIGIRRK